MLQPVNCKYLDSAPGSLKPARSLRLSESYIGSYAKKLDRAEMGGSRVFTQNIREIYVKQEEMTFVRTSFPTVEYSD